MVSYFVKLSDPVTHFSRNHPSSGHHPSKEAGHAFVHKQLQWPSYQTQTRQNEQGFTGHGSNVLEWCTGLHFMPKLTCSMSDSVVFLIQLRPRGKKENWWRTKWNRTFRSRSSIENSEGNIQWIYPLRTVYCTWLLCCWQYDFNISPISSNFLFMAQFQRHQCIPN